VFEVEVDNLGKRVHLRRLEVSYELRQTFLELRIYIVVVSIGRLQSKLIRLTNHRLETILALNRKIGLAR
jgi:hypothetical protein